ncbi:MULTISPECIES: tripartite tricarboxylate transporter substrate-binding protein [Ramlibacter]|uniref:Tripartite tricarboxylate transporter substrate binding protein n=1 Tax=Ramlibacter pinisoli TaxID=2682844 RepID=A0A6N8IW93_9BURK|nr:MULTISPECIES: tripartite tricarboxylate transporter substrate-binding protein [Ramlibacter]MBA2965279.1 tripartite tricarboxylate transporter substrate binding protein [Ramlibacter sp. CGMCC 1.13660]MVQ30243.1 tripartite tricarboxylate transporter substrate binding protein [Ramlibacter pinisoli]
MPFRHSRRAAIALVLAAAATSPAFAQRVIRIVVPFGPGAVQDTVARTFNAELGQALGASVVVENRPGAGGTVGTAQVARATDNNTLVLAAASHTLAGHLYSKLDYDPIKNFTGVAYIGNSGYVIAAPGNLGVNSLADYVKLLKSKSGQLNYASAGNGSATHLGMAYFLAKAGVEMQHVPMKSTGDAVNEVLAGRVQGVTSALIGITAFKQDPRIKLLAYTGTQRSKFLPELPTAAEAGVPGYKFESWIGVLAPSTMPRAEVDRLNAAINKVLGEPAVQERLARLGVESGAMQVDAFQQLLKADYEQAGVLVKASGARIE